MTSELRGKLKKILQDWKPGMVATYSWLEPRGISHQLVEYYVKSGWFMKLGAGAFTRVGDQPTWSGGVYVLQKHLNLPVHIGGRTSIELRGYGHYIRTEQRIHLYGAPHLKLPTWFKELDLFKTIYTTTKLFNHSEEGISPLNVDGFDLACSSLERALLEILSHVPQLYGYAEAAHLMEGMNALRPKMVQALLVQCRSIKAKRLFLHLATECHHLWVNQLDVTKISLGNGIRQLPGGHHFDKKYLIYVPDRELNEGLA
jgi:hypothetical protein